MVLSGVNCKRNYKHSKQELSLTRVVVMSVPKCVDNEMPIIIHSAAHSSGKYFNRRQLSRNTWVREAKAHNMRPLFMMGLPNNRQTQRQLQLEAKQHKDIIQFAFIDDYYNLTLKALSALYWISRNCLKSSYILKCDDDVLVNVPLLQDMVKRKQFSNGLTGKMTVTRSNRFAGHKWFMPRNVYQSNFYQFLYGFSYIMSNASLQKMYKTSINYTGNVLDIDDLFMTGVLAEKARVGIYHDTRFDRFCSRYVCELSEMLVTHGCDSVNQTLYMWNEWQRTKDKECLNRRSNSFGFDFDLFNLKLSVNLDEPDIQFSSGHTFSNSDIKNYNQPDIDS